MTQRRFLFLQGVSSPMFRRLAKALRERGAAVHKVNFNMGDWAYWGANEASHFRAPLPALPAWLTALVNRLHSTDLMLFGDCRPVHQAALALAPALGLRVHVMEEGYFRPYWFTLERDGVNARSQLPRDPRWYLETGRALPKLPPPVHFTQRFRVRALHDVAYHAAGVLNPLGFPHYRTHAGRIAPLEYAGFLRRALRLRLSAARDEALSRQWLEQGRPFYLLPLQLDHDSQIRQHSRFAGMAEVVEEVLVSFARHAPGDAGLMIKNHPLDYRWRSLEAQTKARCAALGIGHRVCYLETGDLQTLVASAEGVVTINSTVGTLALAAGRPVIALGKAIYHMDGLSFEGQLDAFWRDGTPPDPVLYARFERVVMHTTQINGGLFGRRAIALGLGQAADRLLSPRSVLEDLLEAGR